VVLEEHRSWEGEGWRADMLG